jgi:GNAT superfamily N-acetyltransferase
MFKRSVKTKYRHIKPDEMPELLALYKHLHAADDPMPEGDKLQQLWQENLSDKKMHLLVAESENRIVASCVLVVIPNLTRGGRPYGFIENVVTHTDYRKKGIGTGLLKYAQQIAWNKGCYKVMLMTSRQQPEIFRFYENAGFQRGTKTGFIIKHEEPK